MKTITIPDWLYKKILMSKNQHDLANGLTLNSPAELIYKDFTKNFTSRKKQEEFFEWLEAGDYTPEIPIGFWVQVFLESYAELGTASKYKGDHKKYLYDALSFYEDIGDTSSENYRILKEVIKRAELSS